MSDGAIHLAADVLDCCMTVSPELQAEMRYRDCLLFAQALHAAGLLTTTRKGATMTTTEPDRIKNTAGGNPINPASCTPDQVFEGTVDGRRVTLRRNRPSSAYPWNAMSIDRSDEAYYSDDEISDPVPLVPARPVTWADIPEYIDGRDELWGLPTRLRELIAEHINARGGAPLAQVIQLTAERDAALARAEKAEKALADIGDDPIVVEIRESDVAAVEVTQRGGFWWAKDHSALGVRWSAEDVWNLIEGDRTALVGKVAILRAIEAKERSEKAAARDEWTTALFGDGALFSELDGRERGLVDRAISKAGEDK